MAFAVPAPTVDTVNHDVAARVSRILDYVEGSFTFAATARRVVV